MSKESLSGLFFGRSVALLLVMLFSLTGGQMVLSQVSQYQAGRVLGDDDNKSSQGEEHRNNRNSSTVVPTITLTPTPTSTTTTTTTTSTTSTPNSTSTTTTSTTSTTSTTTTEIVSPDQPAVTVTPEPTQAEVETETTNETQAESVQTSAGGVVTTTNEVDRSTSETVRQIIRKFGLPAAAPTVRPTNVVREAEKAIEQKTAGEILTSLLSIRTKDNKGLTEVRLRFKTEDGVVKLVGETEKGEAVEIPASQSAEIARKLSRSSALAVTGQESGEFLFTRGQMRAVTSLPLLIDLRTNLLTTETSTGIKTVSLLPDEAVKIAFASKVVDKIVPPTSNAEIALNEAENGHLTYQINGLSLRKIFGLIPVNLKETAYIDAATGQVTQTEKSLGQLLLELIAFPTK